VIVHPFGEHRGPLIGGDRAAEWHRRHRQDDVAALVGVECRLHRLLLEGAEAHGKLVAMLGETGDGAFHVADAGGEHEEIVGQAFAGGDHDAGRAIDGFGGVLQVAHADPLERGEVLHQRLRAAVPDDVVHAHRAGHEGVFRLDHGHLGGGHHGLEIARGADAAPSAAHDDDADRGLGPGGSGQNACREGRGTARENRAARRRDGGTMLRGKIVFHEVSPPIGGWELITYSICNIMFLRYVVSAPILPRSRPVPFSRRGPCRQRISGR
jgi:hypothetical protein